MNKNSDILRKQEIKSSSKSGNNSEFTKTIDSYENVITTNKFESELILKETKKKLDDLKTKRLSVDLHDEDVIDEIEEIAPAEQYEDETLQQLKNRLLNNNNASKPEKKSTITTDEKVHYEEEKQEDILKDMLQFIQGIKDGANAFNEKLNQDESILNAATTGLEITSKKLAKTRNSLSVKSLSDLGLLDFIKLFGLLVFLFIFSLILIKLLPKW